MLIEKISTLFYNIIFSITTIIKVSSTDAKLFQQVLKCTYLVHQWASESQNKLNQHERYNFLPRIPTRITFQYSMHMCTLYLYDILLFYCWSKRLLRTHRIWSYYSCYYLSHLEYHHLHMFIRVCCARSNQVLEGLYHDLLRIIGDRILIRGIGFCFPLHYKCCASHIDTCNILIK